MALPLAGMDKLVLGDDYTMLGLHNAGPQMPETEVSNYIKIPSDDSITKPGQGTK